MYTKKIEFEDFSGAKRTFDAHFHLTKAEVMRWMTMSGDYTLDKILERLMNERNGKKILETFEDLIHRSYGVISLDNMRFMKNEEAWLAFYETEAYSNFLMELATDAAAATEFVNKVFPKDISDEVSKILSENPDGIPDAIKDYIPNTVALDQIK